MNHLKQLEDISAEYNRASVQVKDDIDRITKGFEKLMRALTKKSARKLQMKRR